MTRLMNIRLTTGLFLACIVACQIVAPALASDWPRFRGPEGLGVSPDPQPVPTTWTATENVKWSVDLPGPGSSSPIVVGDRVFVTCWTGYGMDRNQPGDQAELKRNLICLDRRSGKTLWSRAVDAVLPEDVYRGMFTQHGYASHTPCSDGERVYVFFGKTGVLAFDLEGNRLWQKSVGTGLGDRNWGTASSPILYDNLVIVPAFAENQSVVALDKKTGDVVWTMSDEYLRSTWSTPILAKLADGRTELVLAIPFEVWGCDPKTGKVLWYCESYDGDSLCTSPVAHDGVVYVVGGRNGGAIAVRAGGKQDVAKTHVVWNKHQQARINTPIYYEGRLYWINRGKAYCIDAKTGETVYEERLARAPAAEQPAPGQRGGRRRGGFGSMDYASPVAADGKLYFVSRRGETVVLALGPKFQELARNRFGSDEADFSATPAISDGDLFIRSSKKLYCVGNAPTAPSE